MQEFTTSGIFVVPEGVTKLLVEAWGAGGGGGQTDAVPDPLPVCGGAGGAGAYSRTVLNVVEGTNVIMTIGQGGSGGGPNNGHNGGTGESTTVASGNISISSGGGTGGQQTVCPGGAGCIQGANGIPGTPDPNAPLRWSALIVPEVPNLNGHPSYGSDGVQYNTLNPAPGTIQPLGGYGGLGACGSGSSGAPGANGYALITW
jgi:hypothetical protein